MSSTAGANKLHLNQEQRVEWANSLAKHSSPWKQYQDRLQLDKEMPSIFKEGCKFDLQGLTSSQLHAIDAAVRYACSPLGKQACVASQELPPCLEGLQREEGYESDGKQLPSPSSAPQSSSSTNTLSLHRLQLSVAPGGGKTAILIWCFLLLGGPALVITNSDANKKQFFKVIEANTDLSSLGEVRIVIDSMSENEGCTVCKFTGSDHTEHVIASCTVWTIVICDLNVINDLQGASVDRRSLNKYIIASSWKLVLIDEAEETCTPKLRNVIQNGLHTMLNGESVTVPFPETPIIFTSGTLTTLSKNKREFFQTFGGPLLHVSLASDLEESGVLAKCRITTVLCRNESTLVREMLSTENKKLQMFKIALSGMLPSMIEALEMLVTLHTMWKHKVVIFTWYVPQAEALRYIFPSAVVVVGSDILEARENSINRYEAPVGKDHPFVLGTTSLWQRGWSHDEVTVVISLGIDSPNIIMQRFGRSVRLLECDFGIKVAFCYELSDDRPERCPPRKWGTGDTIDRSAVVDSKKFNTLSDNGYRDRLNVMTLDSLRSSVRRFMFEDAPEAYRLDPEDEICRSGSIALGIDNPIAGLHHALFLFERTCCMSKKGPEPAVARCRANAANAAKPISKRPKTATAVQIQVSVGGSSSSSKRLVAQFRKQQATASSGGKKGKSKQSDAKEECRVNLDERESRDLKGLMQKIISTAEKTIEFEDETLRHMITAASSPESTNGQIWACVDSIYSYSKGVFQKVDQMRANLRNDSCESFGVKDQECAFLERECQSQKS